MFTPFAFVKQAGAGGGLAAQFIAASGVTGSAIITALNNLETDLNTYGLTSKMLALYPLVGGTISTVKWNFMNPVDSDAAYRLEVVGNVNIAANGVSGSNKDLGGGFNNGLNTNLFQSQIYAAYGDYNNHMSFWCVNNPSQVPSGILYPVEVGADDQAGIQYYTNARYYASNTSKTLNLAESGTRFVARTTSPVSVVGFWCSTRTSSTNLYFYRKQGASVQDDTATGTETQSMSGANVSPISLTTAGGASSNRQIGFVSLGSGLTNTQVQNLATVVENFTTTLGR
jgi:hypothetical protein